MVAVAGDPAVAAIWVDALRQDGIDAATFQRGPSAALGGLFGGALIDYPVLVDPSRIADARNVVAELGGAGQLSPIPTDGGGLGGPRVFLLPLLVLVFAVGVIATMRILGD
jgi:hypothetical protein